MAAQRCPNCDAEVMAGAYVCPNCGATHFIPGSGGAVSEPGADENRDEERRPAEEHEDRVWDERYSLETHRAKRQRLVLLVAGLAIAVAIMIGLGVQFYPDDSGETYSGGLRACTSFNKGLATFVSGDLKGEELRDRVAKILDAALKAEPSIKEAAARMLAATGNNQAFLEANIVMTGACTEAGY